MPQIRVSEESYRLLKERAARERRSLSNMVEVLLIPTVDDVQITNLARGTITEPPAEAALSGLASGPSPLPPLDAQDIPPDEGKASYRAARGAAPRGPGEIMRAEDAIRRGRGDEPLCTCAPAERRRSKGKLGPHKLGCPAREAMG